MADELITQRTVPESIDIEKNILSYLDWDTEMRKNREEAQKQAQEVLDFNSKLDKEAGRLITM